MAGVGVDTIRLRFGVLGFDISAATAQLRDVGSEREHWVARYTMPLSGGGSLIISGGTGWVEASLPRRKWTHNARYLPSEEVMPVASRLLRQVTSWADIDVNFDNVGAVRVTRLDIGKDFMGVPEPSRLAEGLGQIWQSPAYRVNPNRRGDRTVSLTIGPKDPWKATVYDKYEESKRADTVGQVRFELCMRADRLTSTWAAEHGGIIRAIDDINQDRIEELARSTFDMLSLGARVVSKDEATRIIASCEALSATEQNILMGYLAREAAGVPHRMSRNTARKYSERARNLGVRLAPELKASAIRLDWDAAKVIEEAA